MYITRLYICMYHYNKEILCFLFLYIHQNANARNAKAPTMAIENIDLKDEPKLPASMKLVVPIVIVMV